MKIIIAALLLIHGLIHCMGFAKAFQYGDMKQLSIPIAKTTGIIWLLTAFLFVASFVLFLLKKDYWNIVAIAAIVLSQVVIIMSWKDAKFGTMANILLLLTAIFSWGNNHFENAFRKDVIYHIARTQTIPVELVTENDLQHLPLPVQRYLRYTGVVNKPKVNNMKIEFEGQMRDKGKDYFPFTSTQFNCFDEPTRLFYMKAKMMGVMVPGYHRYANAIATMDIRFFGLFPIVKKEGEVMNTTETVTLFNDMCLMAPATLIDKRIQWQTIDSNTVKAIFTNHNISITAVLYFNTKGQLINFISNDRTNITDMKQYPFSTPIHSYAEINGFHLMHTGDAVWQMPDGDFIYGRIVLKRIEYNTTN